MHGCACVCVCVLGCVCVGEWVNVVEKEDALPTSSLHSNEIVIRTASKKKQQASLNDAFDRDHFDKVSNSCKILKLCCFVRNSLNRIIRFGKNCCTGQLQLLFRVLR